MAGARICRAHSCPLLSKLALCSIFSQMLEFFPLLEFESCVRERQTERHARGFSSWTQFVTLLFAQLEHAQLPREITGGLAARGQTGASGRESPKRSTLPLCQRAPAVGASGGRPRERRRRREPSRRAEPGPPSAGWLTEVCCSQIHPSDLSPAVSVLPGRSRPPEMIPITTRSAPVIE